MTPLKWLFSKCVYVKFAKVRDLTQSDSFEVTIFDDLTQKDSSKVIICESARQYNIINLIPNNTHRIIIFFRSVKSRLTATNYRTTTNYRHLRLQITVICGYKLPSYVATNYCHMWVQLCGMCKLGLLRGTTTLQYSKTSDDQNLPSCENEQL